MGGEFFLDKHQLVSEAGYMLVGEEWKCVGVEIDEDISEILKKELPNKHFELEKIDDKHIRLKRILN